MLSKFLILLAVSWNLLFLVVFLSTIPLVELWLELEGSTAFVTGWLSLGLLPIVFIITLISKGGRVARYFFYGIQIPLIAVVLVRLAIARDGTLSTNLASIAWILGTIGYALYTYANTYTQKYPLVFSAALSFSLLSGLWLGLLFLLYVPPALLITTKALFFDGFISLLGSLFLLLTLSIIYILPVSVSTLYTKVWWHHVRNQPQRLATSTLTIGLTIAAIVSTSYHTHQQTFDALDSGSLTTGEIRAAESSLKKDLVDIVLYPFRYIGSRDSITHLQELYRKEFGLEWVGRASDTILIHLLSPILYDGPSSHRERKRARELYAEIFDVDIEADNKEAFRTALKATWGRRSRQAGLLDAGAQSVRLQRQDISLKVLEESVAEIELHETFVNLTDTQQEVFYTFELPETAVITGLWLGPTAKKNEAFAFRVSPRGAAQAVYKTQVQRRVDPALLEQVGPRQYRLRVFPIAPIDGLGRLAKQSGPPQHLWLRYRSLPKNGVWPLPHLLQARNVFWDYRTKLKLNGEHYPRPAKNAWLPEALELGTPPTLEDRTVNVTNYRIKLSAKPLLDAQITSKALVVLDTSYSMFDVSEEVKDALNHLRKTFPDSSKLLVSSSGSKGKVASSTTLIPVANWSKVSPEYHGGLSLTELWIQARRISSEFDVVIILTDAGDSAQSPEPLSETPKKPLWFVHLGGHPSAGYDDRFLEAINRSGGGVTLGAKELSQRISHPGLRKADNFTIHIEQNSTSGPNPIPSALAPLAAKWLVEQFAPHAMGNAEELETWHQLAKSESIVTPFSSMIVLVNDSQHKQLDRAELGKDRFEREIEGGQTQAFLDGSALTTNTITATPEPGTWLLLGVGGLIAIGARTRKKETT